jgi:hypothetical protein
VEFASVVAARGAGEIGMHLHAWNSPPLEPLTSDDFRYQPYLIEYPDRVMKEKIKVLTRLLEERFDQKMISHRAGRWAFDGRYAALLLEEGYRVDCSVTPGVDWRGTMGNPAGNGGTNYTNFPQNPYYVNPSDISLLAAGTLLEVPVTVRRSGLHRKAQWAYRTPWLRRAANGVSPGLRWLYPAKTDLNAMLQLAREARAEGATHMEFMLHSSQLMPGGSPSLRNASDIERLYESLEILFGAVAGWCRGMTLKEFHAWFRKSQAEEMHGLPRAQGPAPVLQ